MNKIQLFWKGFVEGWKAEAARQEAEKLAKSQKKALLHTAPDNRDVRKVLTSTEIDAVIELLAQTPAKIEDCTQTICTQPQNAYPDISDILDADDLVDVFQCLAEAPMALSVAATSSDTSTNTSSSIPVFFFAETVENDIDEAIDPAYEAWIDMAQQGYYC